MADIALELSINIGWYGRGLEMGRQIVHLEKFINQVNKTSEKILSRRTY
jgi:hypothetical protein